MAFALEFRDYDLRSFFLDVSERERALWEDVGNTRAFFNGIPLCAASETNGSESSLSALLRMRTTRLWSTYAQSSFACTASVVRARS